MGIRQLVLISLLGLWIGLMIVPSGAAPTVHTGPLRLGVNMHPLQDAYAPSQLGQQVELLSQINASMVRIDLHWAWIEPTAPGPANWNQSQIERLDSFLALMAAHNIDVLATVMEAPCWASTDPNKNCTTRTYNWRYPPRDSQEYATFVGELVRRYKGQIRYWEVWNEPNHVGFWAHPDPVTYTALVKAAYPTIKALDPTAVVVAGALAPCDGTPTCAITAAAYLETMYAAGARGSFDKLSYHPYTDGHPPSWYDARWPMHSIASSVPAMRQVMQRNGDASPIWLTELGWTTVPGERCADCWTATLPVSETAQAAYLAEAVAIARNWNYVEALLWYELIDMVEPWDPTVVSFEHHFGLFRRDYSPKPAAEQFRLATLTRVYLPLVIRQSDLGPLRPHQTTTIGTGQTAQGSFSDGMAPYSEDWLWAHNHFRIQRIRREEQPTGCAIATYAAHKVWLSTGTPASVLINGLSVGTITNIAGQQRHGYVVDLAIHVGDTVCISPISANGFHIIFGPDVYYHYDSYCYRGHC